MKPTILLTLTAMLLLVKPSFSQGDTTLLNQEIDLKLITKELVDAEDHKIFSYILLGAGATCYYMSWKKDVQEWQTPGVIFLSLGVTVDIWSTLKRREASMKLRRL